VWLLVWGGNGAVDCHGCGWVAIDRARALGGLSAIGVMGVMGVMAVINGRKG
jgi:hypothetical protein